MSFNLQTLLDHNIKGFKFHEGASISIINCKNRFKISTNDSYLYTLCSNILAVY